MTRADLKHCGKIPDAREELNRSVREGRIESRHSIKSLEGMGSSSHDLGAELRMHSFTVNCDTFSNEEKVAAVVPFYTQMLFVLVIHTTVNKNSCCQWIDKKKCYSCVSKQKQTFVH